MNLPHVGRRLDAWCVFKDDIADTDEYDDRAGRVSPPFFTHDDASDEDVENTTADEREHEGRISGDLRRYLEFCVTDQPMSRVLSGVAIVYQEDHWQDRIGSHRRRP